jgi:tryptophan synthase alpha chain
MSRIAQKFDELQRLNRKAFIPYITAGDPNLAASEALIIELENNGADLIELGVPFSDPVADGPVIQRASERALRNGVTVTDCLDLVTRVRRQSDVPIVLFSYLNPLLALGFEQLGTRLRDAGVDGVIATDLVPEEADDFKAVVEGAGVETVFLAAPTSSDDRLRRIADASSGFVYAVSRTGVTGVRQSLSDAAAAVIGRLRRFTSLPIAVGFGISTDEHVNQIWRHADAAVVGSRIVAEIEEAGGSPDLVSRIGKLTRFLVQGRDGRISGSALQ